VKILWNLVLPAIETGKPVLIVGPSGCGKSETILTLLNVLFRENTQFCMTPETEPSELVGQYLPAGTEKQSIEWKDGIISDAFSTGKAVLLDNIQDADACVLERLNSVLEIPATWLKAEQGAVELEVGQPNFRILATMTTSSATQVSPALSNRFSIVNMLPFPKTYEDAIKELTSIVNVLCEEAIESETVVHFCSNLWTRLNELSGLSQSPHINFRSIIRLVDCSFNLRRRDRNISLNDSIILAYEMTMFPQFTVQEKNAMKFSLESFLPVSDGTRFDFNKWLPSNLGDAEMSDHVLPPARLLNACSVIIGVIGGYPILLEGPPAVGKILFARFVELVYGFISFFIYLVSSIR
jgi:midasin (ATPase involved in ribosome maturation)